MWLRDCSLQRLELGPEEWPAFGLRLPSCEVPTGVSDLGLGCGSWADPLAGPWGPSLRRGPWRRKPGSGFLLFFFRRGPGLPRSYYSLGSMASHGVWVSDLAPRRPLHPPDAASLD